MTATFLAVPAAAQAGPTVQTAATSTPLIVNDDDSAQVQALGMGTTASAAVTAESRGYAHTDLQPTGRFVQSGDSITFEVSGDAATVSYTIAATGVYSDLNGGADGATNPRSTALSAGSTTVTAGSDGLVYLSNSSAVDMAVTVTGGSPVPVFVAGQTSTAEFTAQLEQWPDSRFVTFVAERIFADIQRSEVNQIRTADASWDPEAMVDYWNQVVVYANEVHGLLDNAVGVAYKSPLRMRVVNPDTGAGYASAQTGRITFPVGTGAGQKLLKARDGTDNWGMWHEVGHTYQNPEYKWEDMAEVQVNLYSASIEARMGWSTRYSASSSARKAAVALFAQPVEERSRSGSSHELMFEQLRRAFGDSFYPRLNQEYRVQLATGRTKVTDNDAKVQLFIINASLVANRDLSEFFRQWGLTADADTLAAVADLPALTHTIWDTLDPLQMAAENILTAYRVPTGNLSTVSTVVLGQTTVPEATVTALSNTDGQGTTTVIGTGATTTPSSTTGSAWALLENDSDVREVISSTVTVQRGEGLTFRGVRYDDGDETALTLALAPDTNTLQVWSKGRAVHSYFSGKVYFSLELRTADGRTVVSAEQDGGDNADAFAAAFSGVTYQDGDYLIATHQEPNRLNRYVDSVLQSTSTAQTQAFRIENGSLVPVSLDEVPEPTPAALVLEAVPPAQAGIAYQYSFSATGTAPITFTVDGDLPEGITLETTGGNTAQLVGTPTTAGSFNLTLFAAGVTGAADSAPVTIEVAAAAVEPEPTTDPEGPEPTSEPSASPSTAPSGDPSASPSTAVGPGATLGTTADPVAESSSSNESTPRVLALTGSEFLLFGVLGFGAVLVGAVLLSRRSRAR